MRRRLARLRAAPAALACTLALAAAPAIVACGEEEGGTSGDGASDALPGGGEPASGGGRPGAGGPADPGAAGGGPAGGPPKPAGGIGPAEGPTGDPRVTALERDAARSARAYVAAIDARDGRRLCALLGDDAVAQIDLPRERSGCPASLEASIGFRDPRGLPVWAGSRTLETVSVELSPDLAKVVLTVLTEFADRDEPSVEDDVVYLERVAGGWRIAKPSSTLLRAVGVADVPPAVLAPPR